MNYNLAGIRHISFDVWGTLISANPEYAEMRNTYLAMVLGLTNKTVRQVYTQVKTEVDQEAELEGTGPSTPQVLKRLYDQFGDYIGPNDRASMFEVHAGIRALFRRYPPIVLPEIKKMIGELKRAGYNVSIASNTNFISGATMQDVLFDKWPTQFDFALYSDAFGHSKPSSAFFNAILVNARSRAQANIAPALVMHVGDNQICDVGGATKASMRPMYVKDPADTVKLLMP
jgi:putative hydrolase of the HAD superfamily